MATPRVLVAGVGNIFLGDDGFGSEVARRLDGVPMPAGVRVVDFGIGGIHLVYELLDGYETLVLVDTVSRGGKPGSVYVIEIGDSDIGDGQLDAHSMDPVAVLASVRKLGGTLPRTTLVGCEPADVGDGIGLSPVVDGAIDVAVDTVREVVAAACGER